MTVLGTHGAIDAASARADEVIEVLSSMRLEISAF